MRDDDLLTESMRALRESTDGTSAQLGRTRFQILARAQERARRKRRTAFVVLPVAAAFVASTAWAAATHRLPRWVDALAWWGSPSVTTVEAPSASIGLTPSPIPSRSAVVATAPVEAPTVPIDALPSAPPPALARPPRVLAPAKAVSPAPKELAVSSEEQLAYSTAHQAHFVDRDPDAAIRGWDLYLAAYPDGHFAPEARYNRAISLVRLGRHREGREALTPFAEGKYGGYRRAEARELLDAIVASDGGSRGP